MHSRFINCTSVSSNEIEIDGELLKICDTEAYYDEEGFMEVKYHLINETKHRDEHIYLNIDFSSDCSYLYPTTGKVIKIIKDAERRDYVINMHSAAVNCDSDKIRIEVLENLLTYHSTRMIEVDDRWGVLQRIIG